MVERRIPPQNLDAEASLLGGILLRSDALDHLEGLQPADFYDPRHGHVFQAILELQQKHKPIDIITLEEQLKAADKLTAVGGVSFLSDIASRVVTAANIGYYVGIVKEKALARRLIEAAADVSERGYGDIGDIREFLDDAERKIFQITEQRATSSTRPIKDVMTEVIQTIGRRLENPGDVRGIPSGFTDLDQLTSGLQPSDLVILAARPSMGKCLRKGSLVPISDGRLVPIELLVDQESGVSRGDIMTLEGNLPDSAAPDELHTADSSSVRIRTFRPSPVSAWISDGEKPCFRVRTALGREIETTITHPFLTPSGWKPLGQVAVGDSVAVVRRLEIFGALHASPAYVRTLAYALVGAPQELSSRRAFQQTLSELGSETEMDEESKQRVSRVVKALAVRRASLSSVGSARLARAALSAANGGEVSMRSHIEDSHGSASGRASLHEAETTRSETPQTAGARAEFYPSEIRAGEVGAEVFRLKREHVAEYLRVVLGRSILSAQGLRWIAPNENAARQISHLCLRFGVVAKLRSSRVHGGSVSLEISDPESLVTLAREIGAEGQEAKLTRFAKAWSQRLGQARPEAGDVLWDRVLSIESTGVHPVFDLTVEQTHNFVANDICVHNTALAMSIAQNAGLGREKEGTKKFPVIVFSLEMSAPQIVERMICSEARIESTALRRGMLQHYEMNNLTQASMRLSSAPIWIDDTPGPTVQDVRARARRWRADKKLFPDESAGGAPMGLIVVDYLQLMKGSAALQKNGNREQEISEISRGLKGLAKELKCPVLALAQLNRGVEQRADKRPMLSDLRESGAIEQDADVIMFIYRDEVYNKESKEKGVAEVIIGKQRNGPIDTVKIAFMGRYTRFENLSSRRDEM